MARRRFEKSAINRIILCTDGDFNVGITSREDLKSLIETQAKSGVFLSVLGFGMGNTKDDTMEMLADKGNGHYGYVDSFTEARKVFSEQLEGTLVTVAKDVKIQVEFNPAKVATWRLLGYENRVMAAQDFNDDRKDAGEVGAGHTVTALYEVVPVGMVAGDRPEIDGLRYREVPAESDSRENRRVRPAPQHAEELLFLKVRYKKPDGDQSILMEQAVKDGATPWKQASGDFKFAAAVAGFGMLLRDSPNRGDTTFESVLRLAEEGLGRDENGYRAEFIDLVRKAQSLK
jgi:secreted protein with Ig-like and vWFA domain